MNNNLKMQVIEVVEPEASLYQTLISRCRDIQKYECIPA